MNAGKKKAMEKFLFNALTVDLQENQNTSLKITFWKKSQVFNKKDRE